MHAARLMIPETEDLISLVVCTRNRAPALARLLLSVAEAMRSGGPIEVVVVDNASSDKTGAIIDRFRAEAIKGLRTVLEPRTGLGAARNAGILLSTGPILVFVDDDCLCPGSFFLQVRRMLTSGPYAYGGGRLLPHDSADVGDFNDFRSMDVIPPRSFIPPGFVSGGCMAFRREVIEDVGLFDPEFGAGTRWRCEDVDYCQRVSSAGYWGVRFPALFAYHAHGRSSHRAIREQQTANARARGAYYVKHALKGDKRHLLVLVKSATSLRSITDEHSQELVGALSYTIARAKNAFN